jgi:hypothetical protein
MSVAVNERHTRWMSLNLLGWIVALLFCDTVAASVIYKFDNFDDPAVTGMIEFASPPASSSTGWGPDNNPSIVTGFSFAGDTTGIALTQVPGAVFSSTGVELDAGRVLLTTNAGNVFDIFFGPGNTPSFDFVVLTPLSDGNFWNGEFRVPEPAVSLLMGIGLMALSLVKSRSR